MLPFLSGGLPQTTVHSGETYTYSPQKQTATTTTTNNINKTTAKHHYHHPQLHKYNRDGLYMGGNCFLLWCQWFMCGSEVTGERLLGLFTSWLRFLSTAVFLPHWFVGTISTLFCYVNIKIILCRLASSLYEIEIWVAFVDIIAVLALWCNPIDFIWNQSGGL